MVLPCVDSMGCQMNNIPKINLMPWRELRRIRKNDQFRRALILVTVLSAGLVGGAYIYEKGKLNHQKAINDDIANRISALDADIVKIAALENEQKALLDKVTIINDLHGNRAALVRFFEYLARTSAGLVYFERITLSGEMLTLTGVSRSSADVSRFSQSISTDVQSVLDDVMVVGLQDAPNGAVNFVISAKLILDSKQVADSSPNDSSAVLQGVADDQESAP